MARSNGADETGTNSLKTALLRVDGSARIGMGHVMRCLAIADGLRGVDMIPRFVLGPMSSGAAALVTSHGFAVDNLPASTSTQADAEVTLSLAQDHEASFILTDVAHQDALADRPALNAYHETLTGECYTVCIAGSSLIDIPANILISPYYRKCYPEPEALDERLILLGPSYFVFRREFIKAAAVPRNITEVGHRVLVTIGGSDELHITSQVIRALSLLEIPLLHLRVVIGPGYTTELHDEILKLLASLKGRAEVLDHTASLADAMLWADVAVTGDGLTKYETAVTGTPSITLSRPGGEQALGREFDSAGTSEHAGDATVISVQYLAHVIGDLLKDAPRRREMSGRGRRLIDGAGLERILRHIPAVVPR